MSQAAGEGRPRVASLLPAATEIVCALGRGGDLVGVSHECDWPPEVTGRPVLTAARLPGGGGTDSGTIDRSVREALRDALAVYRVDEEALAAARPDVVVTQDLCDVCAVPFADVEAAVRRRLHQGAVVVSLSPTRLDDVRADVRRVGGALGCVERSEDVVAAMDARLADLAARLAPAGRRPRVLTIEWLDPPMVGGTWMPELVRLAGGEPLVTRPGDHAPTLDIAALDALDPAPEAVLVKPCGYTLERTLGEWDRLVALLADRPWPALASGDVWVADGNAYFNRPGPRLVDSAEILAAALHPSCVPDLVAAHAHAFVRVDVRGTTPPEPPARAAVRGGRGAAEAGRRAAPRPGAPPKGPARGSEQGGRRR